MRILHPELTLVSGELLPNCSISILDSGHIGAITIGESQGQLPGENLDGQILIPGLVNGHSHAFQRAIRGKTHSRPHGRSDFWSWREAMYGVVESLTPEYLYDISHHAFLDMLEAGYTHVGEFHYVHHQQGGKAYADENELSNTVIQAAVDAGILITLLRVVYLKTGYEAQSPSPGQLRFMDSNVEESIESVERLMERWEHHPGVNIGIAPHSVRAVHGEDLKKIGTWARGKDIPVHIHASEQTGEVTQTLAATGFRPVELLNNTGLLGPKTTLVHGTHLSNQEREFIAQTGTTICICPSTEADLGDGLIELSPLLDLKVPMTLGSDSQAIIDPFHEMRSLDMHERLRTQRRTPTTPEGGQPGALLLEMSTTHGWASLGWSPGGIQEGAEANLISLNRSHPALLGLSKKEICAGVTLHGDRTLVANSWVHGKPIIRDGKHAHTQRSRERFSHTLSRLFS